MDPRADAIMRAMGGMAGEAPPMPMEEGAPPGGDPASAAMEAMAMLEPFADDPKIAQALSLLQEAAGGPTGNVPEDTEETMEEGPVTDLEG